MERLVGSRHLLVDFENVQKIDFDALPADFDVTIFVGCAQKNIPFEVVQSVQSLGVRGKWLKIEGGGSNALDFHIAYYLGSLMTQCPKNQRFILSRDNGFDPLLCHLKKKGLHCCRIDSLSEL